MAFDPRIENVIVTSEDKSACDEFLALMKKELPSLRVILNLGDVQQVSKDLTKSKSSPYCLAWYFLVFYLFNTGYTHF